MLKETKSEQNSAHGGEPVKSFNNHNSIGGQVFMVIQIISYRDKDVMHSDWKLKTPPVDHKIKHLKAKQIMHMPSKKMMIKIKFHCEFVVAPISSIFKKKTINISFSFLNFQ